jgi:purine nucleoside permease
MKKRISVILLTGLLAGTVFATGASDVREKVKISVLILPKFEIGEMAGDAPGEAQYYYEEYVQGGAEYRISGLPNPLYVKNGVALNVTQMGKAQAAASLASILADTRFDWHNAYIITTGCGGSAKELTVLGDVVIGKYVVDRDLGRTLDPRDVPKGSKLFYRDSSYDSAAYHFIPNAESIYNLVKDVVLTQSEAGKTVMADYPAVWSAREPKVLFGTIMTGDNYWYGFYANELSEEVAEAYNVAPVLITEMEDAALATVTARYYGNLDKFIVIRDSVDIDIPPDGVVITELWRGSSIRGKEFDWGNFTASMLNNFNVGKVIINAILAGNL